MIRELLHLAGWHTWRCLPRRPPLLAPRHRREPLGVVVVTDQPLFPGFEPPDPEPAEDLSPGQRLTRRQADLIAIGRHPLTRAALHPDADRHRDASSGKKDPFTCGSCVHRVPMGGAHDGTFPKCDRDGAWRSNGPATDVRAWWPACTHYQPNDQEPRP